MFNGFRTTRLSRLVISFIDTKNREEAVTFFNVDIKKQRGEGEYETGENGQFFPKKKSNFRKFWMRIVGVEPRSWARVHKEIKSRFKNRLFTGLIDHKERSNREPYLQLYEVTEFGHRNDTEKA